MKQLFLIALMATVSFASKGQVNVFDNTSDCALRIRLICIDEIGCSSTPASTWQSIPANSFGNIIPAPSTTCPAGQSAGYEIDYDVLGCRGMSNYFTTNKNTLCTPPFWPVDNHLLLCSACSDTPLIIQWLNDPSIPVNYIMAHP